MKVHNRGLRKNDLVAQKFFIKKIFFYHIFPFLIRNFLLLRAAYTGLDSTIILAKNFLFVNWKKFTFFYHILEGRRKLLLLSSPAFILAFIVPVFTFSKSRSRSHRTYNTTGEGRRGVREFIGIVLCGMTARFEDRQDASGGKEAVNHRVM